MPSTRPILASLLTTALVAAFSHGAEDLPRYQLPVGRILTYASESEGKDPSGKKTRDSSGTTRMTVVGQNADGSSRVVVEQVTRYGDGPERTAVGGFDVTPEGKATPLSSETRVNIDRVLPLLPADAKQAESTWQSPVAWDSSVKTYTFSKATDVNLFTFNAVEDGPVNRIYVVTNKSTVEFDRTKGAVTKVATESSQGYGFNQKSTGSVTLAKDETTDPSKAAALAKDYTAYFDAAAKRKEIISGMYEAPERTEQLLKEANAVVAAARQGVTSAEVIRLFERQMKDDAEYSKYILQEGERLAKVLNKPAADWSSTDLDGASWSADKLKGKVVVMDFWYRGCGWCMYAMPQVKQLAADYKGQPVVVLGMNTDRVEDDAKFVVKELGLSYPQIKAEGLPAKFGVRGFPTLIVIDQQGVVRAVHVGYSSDLRESVAKQIDKLLAAKPT